MIKTGYPSIDKPWMKYYDEKTLDYKFPCMNIYDYMRKMTYDDRDAIAITYYGKEISYNDFYSHIEQACKFLLKLGVKEQSRIMFLMPNIPETAYLFYAVARIGAIADFVDPRPDSMDLKVSAMKTLSIIEYEKTEFIISLEQCYLAMIKPVERELREIGIEKIVLVSASTSMGKKGKINYLKEKLYLGGVKELKQTLKKQGKIIKEVNEAIKTSILKIINYEVEINQCDEIVIPNIEYNPEWLVAIVHSSGTSGSKPKPIALTHENMNIYVHQTYAANMPMQKNDKVLHMLPYFAAYGLVDVAHAGFCHVNNLIQIPEFKAEYMGKYIKKFLPQTIIGTPSWFQMLLYDKSIKNTNLNCLHMVTYGGDSMEPDDEIKVNEFLKGHNCATRLTKGHGMSESCGCATYANGRYNLPGTVGIPMPYTTYAIVDSETKEMLRFNDSDEYIEGELIISSKILTPGVLDGEVIVPHIEYEGEEFILTRDIARMNRNGVITFLARSDRSFTRYDGFKYKPYEIENLMKQKDGILQCIVCAYDDKQKHGIMPIANIVVDKDLSSRIEKIRYVGDLINELFVKNPDVSSRQIPSKIRFVDTFPMTSNGKVNYKRIEKYEIDGNEINVSFEEDSLTAGDISIT